MAVESLPDEPARRSSFRAGEFRVFAGQEQWRFAARSSDFNPLYRNAYEATPYVVAVYFNTDEPADMNRYYPFIESRVFLTCRDFYFFYLADGEHNPERKTVWTGVSRSGGQG